MDFILSCLSAEDSILNPDFVFHSPVAWFNFEVTKVKWNRKWHPVENATRTLMVTNFNAPRFLSFFGNLELVHEDDG